MDDDGQVERLVDMTGLSREQASALLTAAGGDVSLAVSLFFGEELMPAAALPGEPSARGEDSPGAGRVEDVDSGDDTPRRGSSSSSSTPRTNQRKPRRAKARQQQAAEEDDFFSQSSYDQLSLMAAADEELANDLEIAPDTNSRRRRHHHSARDASTATTGGSAPIPIAPSSRKGRGHRGERHSGERHSGDEDRHSGSELSTSAGKRKERLRRHESHAIMPVIDVITE